ncbi:hypothetical protein [Paraburkholderia atlantica]|nr:hypothetical protein [Paraburkholderia atlantica]
MVIAGGIGCVIAQVRTEPDGVGLSSANMSQSVAIPAGHSGVSDTPKAVA